MSRLTRIWNPAEYQGAGVTRRYFEGWYFKQVDVAEQRCVALIPGVSYSADGSHTHAFVQMIATGADAHYFTYPADAFGFDPRAPFLINVGPSAFSRDHMVLHLDDPAASRRVRGEVRFGPWTPWPVTRLSPGAMGWYRFVPRMETYHGILSMDHDVSGWLEIDGERIDFAGGRGYIEKDWGRSFPSSWIWAQTNHFTENGQPRPGVSLSVSVARVPWMRGAFVGSIAGLLLDGDLHRFATYTGARIRCIDTVHNGAHLVVSDGREELELWIHGCEAAILAAPVLGAMEGKDAESLGGTIEATLRVLRGGRASVVFAGVGRQSAIEVMNDKDELGRTPCEPSVA